MNDQKNDPAISAIIDALQEVSLREKEDDIEPMLHSIEIGSRSLAAWVCACLKDSDDEMMTHLYHAIGDAIRKAAIEPALAKRALLVGKVAQA